MKLTLIIISRDASTGINWSSIPFINVGFWGGSLTVSAQVESTKLPLSDNITSNKPSFILESNLEILAILTFKKKDPNLFLPYNRQNHR